MLRKATATAMKYYCGGKGSIALLPGFGSEKKIDCSSGKWCIISIPTKIKDKRSYAPRRNKILKSIPTVSTKNENTAKVKDERDYFIRPRRIKMLKPIPTVPIIRRKKGKGFGAMAKFEFKKTRP